MKNTIGFLLMLFLSLGYYSCSEDDLDQSQDKKILNNTSISPVYS